MLVQVNEAPEETFLPARKVWERYSVCEMTLHRWLRDERLGFPKPIYLGRYRYWKLHDLREWERAQAAKRGRPA